SVSVTGSGMTSASPIPASGTGIGTAVRSASIGVDAPRGDEGDEGRAAAVPTTSTTAAGDEPEPAVPSRSAQVTRPTSARLGTRRRSLMQDPPPSQPLGEE